MTHKVNRYLFLGGLFLLLSFYSIAQGDSLVVKEKLNPYAIKFSFSSLMAPVSPGPTIAYEHKGKGHYYWRHQLGTILNFDYENQKPIEHLRGIRLATGLRKYKNRNSVATSSSFWEISFDYRYIDVLIGGDFRNTNFSRRIDYNMWQHSASLNFIWGMSGRINNHLHVDFGIGAGLRLNYRQYSPIPADMFFDTNGSLFLWRYGGREPWHGILSVPVILSLGYAW